MKNLLCVCLCLVSVAAFSQEKFDYAASGKIQQQLNDEYANKEESPLLKADFDIFKGLDFFPISEKYFVVAQFKKAENERPFEMKTSTARRPIYQKYGELTFALEGKTLRLNVYQDLDLIKKEGCHDYLFLPFSDLTSGNETYIGGRYIDLKLPKGDTVAIDFNAAYNPYCAYNHKYSCPAVPLENDLPVEIRAGVKKFHD